MKIDSLLIAILAACAIVSTGFVVRREINGTPLQTFRGASASAPVFVRDWQKYIESGSRLGSMEGPVQVIEFADFECPFCGDFHKTLKSVEQKYPGQIGLTYVHYPIPGHRFAMPAARAAECAAKQKRFETMHNRLFEGQDQFGLKSWNDYAAAAGVPDIAAFDACISNTEPIRSIDEGKALGARLNVQGTPTVIINGWELGHTPTETELDQMMKRVLAGKSPVDDKS